ncbi:MAG: hypothetical protein QM725_06430 [Lacibacter sp.]
MKRKQIISYTILALLIIGIAGGIYGYKEFNRTNKSLTDSKPEFEIKITELIKEFASDEKTATAKYSGKILQVEGQVKKVDQDEKGFFTVVLGDTSSMSSVRCSIDSLLSADVSSIKLNAPVLLKGICTGYIADDLGIGADVILNRCAIIKQ